MTLCYDSPIPHDKPKRGQRMENGMGNKYRAEFIAEGMWVCTREGTDDPGSILIYGTKEEATDKARAMNFEAGISQAVAS